MTRQEWILTDIYNQLGYQLESDTIMCNTLGFDIYLKDTNVKFDDVRFYPEDDHVKMHIYNLNKRYRYTAHNFKVINEFRLPIILKPNDYLSITSYLFQLTKVTVGRNDDLEYSVIDAEAQKVIQKHLASR